MKSDRATFLAQYSELRHFHLVVATGRLRAGRSVRCRGTDESRRLACRFAECRARASARLWSHRASGSLVTPARDLSAQSRPPGAASLVRAGSPRATPAHSE